MNPTFARIAKALLFHSPLRTRFFPLYQYQFTPAQLAFLCRCIDETSNVLGCIAEFGCSTGETTVFLGKHIQSLGLTRGYFAIDTFSGFTTEDVEVEVSRGKSQSAYNGFRSNSRKWFDGTVRQNGLHVTSIEADVTEFGIGVLAPISFALIDVDLYRPTKLALPKIYRAMAPGGIIVVDDCDTSSDIFDGAAQAFLEFTKGIGIEPRIEFKKLGVIKV